MATISCNHDIDVDAPAADVWSVLADHRRDAEWREGVERMVPTPDGLVEAGTTTSEDLRVMGRLRHNDGLVTAVEPGARFEWRTTTGAVASGARAVRPLGARRSRVQLELRVTPTGPDRLLTPMLRGMLDRLLAGDLDRLRALVEHEAAARSLDA